MPIILTYSEQEYNGVITYRYYRADEHGNEINDVRCGDLITTNENGQILTVNGNEYVHNNVNTNK